MSTSEGGVAFGFYMARDMYGHLFFALCFPQRFGSRIAKTGKLKVIYGRNSLNLDAYCSSQSARGMV